MRKDAWDILLRGLSGFVNDCSVIPIMNENASKKKEAKILHTVDFPWFHENPKICSFFVAVPFSQEMIKST